jgi:hypothetical protein
MQEKTSGRALNYTFLSSEITDHYLEGAGREIL